MTSADQTQPHESNTVHDTVDATDQAAENDEKRKLRSPVWAHYELKNIKGTQKAVCIYCNKALTYNSNTGTKCLLGKSKKIDDFHSHLVGKKSKKDESGGSVLATHCFNYEDSRMDLARMIAQHDYPLRIVEHEGFRTCNNQRKGYMTVTSHFIDDSWKLQSRILRFIYVPCPHAATKLTYVLLDCLMEWNLDRKLSTLTVDNCSTNDCMIELITEKMPSDGLILGRELFYMQCAAHILSLIVRSGLDSFKGIAKVRESTATPKKWRHLNIMQNIMVLFVKKIALDCKTRWNSTYLMLATTVKYKKVFFGLKNREPQYKSLPDESDWELASELCDRLKIFYSVTELFLGTKYPTTNIFSIKFLALKKWDESKFIEVSTMASSMVTKFDKYWEESYGVMSMATVLDPRFKMKILEFFFPLIYGDDKEKVHLLNVKAVFEGIYQKYDSRCVSPTSNDDSVPTSTKNATPRVKTESLDAFFSWNSSRSVVCGKTELEVYLEENTLPGSHDFDILAWWKLNAIKYPTLSVISRDILAIPISTVASESSFSTSGRIVGPHRSKLLPKTIEAIICTQNWLSGGKKGSLVDGCDDLNVDEDEEKDEKETGAGAGVRELVIQQLGLGLRDFSSVSGRGEIVPSYRLKDTEGEANTQIC
uniref:BED-type domain-containing protein n=1 Tax=Lactuca sativa TaxID=4236 RepID=A0A9R1XDX6_LACSA|nr:hypothetical protein LSAT_V11C400183110 [Lactuca sativa]